VQKFHSSEYINALANGTFVVAFVGQATPAILIVQPKRDMLEIAYTAPKEGAVDVVRQHAIRLTR